MKNVRTLSNPAHIMEAATPEAFAYRERIKHSIQAVEKYQHRRVNKHRAEMKLIERGLQTLPPLNSVLDAPCGIGRACLLLAEKGYDVTGVDLGEAAIMAARTAVEVARANVTIEQADLEQLPYDDASFDACLCFRFIHHLPTAEIREQIIAELCRVTRQFVLISYLNPLSVTSIRRSIRERLGGKPSVQHRISLGELVQHFEHQGFSLHQDLAQLPLLHSLHLAVFKRDRHLTC